MSGPWYEYGPSAKEVRKDVYSYITTSNVGRVKYQKEKDKIIQKHFIKLFQIVEMILVLGEVMLHLGLCTKLLEK